MNVVKPKNKLPLLKPKYDAQMIALPQQITARRSTVYGRSEILRTSRPSQALLQRTHAKELEALMARLEEQNNILQVRVAENTHLRTDIVQSLTDCGTYNSSDGKKTPASCSSISRVLYYKILITTPRVARRRQITVLIVDPATSSEPILRRTIIFDRAEQKMNGPTSIEDGKVKYNQPQTPPEYSPIPQLPDRASKYFSSAPAFIQPEGNGKTSAGVSREADQASPLDKPEISGRARTPATSATSAFAPIT